MAHLPAVYQARHYGARLRLRTGTITRDIAQRIAPGHVIGLDFNAEQVAVASRDARSQGIANVEFKQSSVYELPFADASFDAVFSHALLEHLREPAKAVAEFRRVLKPGGALGVCTPDWVDSCGAAIGRVAAGIRGVQGIAEPQRRRRLLRAQARRVPCGRRFAKIELRARYENYDPLTVIGDFLAVNMEEAGDANNAAVWRKWGRSRTACSRRPGFPASATIHDRRIQLR